MMHKMATHIVLTHSFDLLSDEGKAKIIKSGTYEDNDQGHEVNTH